MHCIGKILIWISSFNFPQEDDLILLKKHYAKSMDKNTVRRWYSYSRIGVCDVPALPCIEEF